MAQQIIKQPNGLYAVFSTTVDQFIIWDATKEEIIAERERSAAEDARRAAEKIFTALEAGQDPYHKMGVTYEEAVASHNARCEAGLEL